MPVRRMGLRRASRIPRRATLSHSIGGGFRPPPPRNLSYALVLVLLGLRRAVKYEQDGKIIPRRCVQFISRFDLVARGDDEDLVLWKDTKHVRAASAV